MKTALIITGGDFSPFEKTEYDIIYACDKGIEYAKKLDIYPDIILGDFDSFDGTFTEDYPKAEVLRFPVEKDDTDTMLAVKDALQKGATHITISCALGKRMDHLISNIQALHYIASHGAVGEIVSQKDHLFTFCDYENPLFVEKKKAFSLSLFSLTEKCCGLSIEGAKYNADDIVLESSFPLGHGNFICLNTAKITLKSGILLIVESHVE